MNPKWGDGLLSLSVLIWMSYSVGPWWVGLVIFFSAGVMNALEIRFWKRRKCDLPELFDKILKDSK